MLAFLTGMRVAILYREMARPTIKSTYTLDMGTIRALEDIARRWRVSKSEALRRAIRAAAGESRVDRSDAVDALDRLQKSLRLTPAKTRAWTRRVRSERHASSVRHEPSAR
jgi:hypothetical protein